MSFESRIELYSGQDLKSLLEGVDFDNTKLYGDLDGNEYGIDAKRLVAKAGLVPSLILNSSTVYV